MASFLPQTSNGWILVTSRNRLAATNLVGRENLIRVELMNEDDALELLQNKFSVGGSFGRDARDLVQALEYIPLAITQAAAYIREREPRITIAIYLQLFHENEKNQTRLLYNEETKDLRRDPTVRHGVIAAWQISFEQIRKTAPAAADLLALMSMYDRQGIPEDLLHDSTNRLQFEDAVAPLTSFSLVRTQTVPQREKKCFEMHRLVQLSTRKWQELNPQLEKWRQLSIRIVAIIFPSGDYESWTACQLLLPHSNMVLGYLSNEENEDEDIVLNWAEIADNMACYLYHRGKYAVAEKIRRVAVEKKEKVLGREHPSTLASVGNLGSVLLRLGRYEEAEAMYRRGLEGQEKVLGQEHLNTLISVSSLGSVLEKLGKYEEAEAMHRRGLKGMEKLLGREHPETLASVYCLAYLLHKQKHYRDASELYHRASSGYEKVLGTSHPDFIACKSNWDSMKREMEQNKRNECRHT